MITYNPYKSKILGELYSLRIETQKKLDDLLKQSFLIEEAITKKEDWVDDFNKLCIYHMKDF